MFVVCCGPMVGPVTCHVTDAGMPGTADDGTAGLPATIVVGECGRQGIARLVLLARRAWHLASSSARR